MALYRSGITDRWNACRSTEPPKTIRWVSFTSLNRHFYYAVCVDHLSWDGTRMFHSMNSSKHFSSGMVCNSLLLYTAVFAIETVSRSSFSQPSAVQSDCAFDYDVFISMVNEHSIKCIPSLPRRHRQNGLQSKHDIIRSILRRLRAADLTSSHAIWAQRSIMISNDLYGSDTRHMKWETYEMGD